VDEQFFNGFGARNRGKENYINRRKDTFAVLRLLFRVSKQIQNEMELQEYDYMGWAFINGGISTMLYKMDK
jgi:hypothetical protein